MGGKILQTRSEQLLRKGRKYGKAEGIHESIINFTKTLLMMRQPYEFIAQATKTSVEDVKRIAEAEGLAY